MTDRSAHLQEQQRNLHRVYTYLGVGSSESVIWRVSQWTYAYIILQVRHVTNTFAIVHISLNSVR